MARGDTTNAASPDSQTVRSADNLLADRSFWGMNVTQFLGAFNDNFFKQSILSLLVAVQFTASSKPVDMQAFAAFAFSIPFILFSGFAGYLADRYSKRTIIVLSKVAEIVIMLLGVPLFLMAAHGITPSLVTFFCLTLFLMGAQSAFFGPSKYGILPELFPERELPRANGLILMATFLAIILGMALGGYLYPDKTWSAGMGCVAIAVLGTLTSFVVRKGKPAKPDLRFTISALAIPSDIVGLLRRDRPLCSASLAAVVFWLAAAIANMSVNSLGVDQLELKGAPFGILVASLSIGIALGSVLAGKFSRGKFNARILYVATIGLLVTLLTLAVPTPATAKHALGYYGCLIALTTLGLFTGLFAVPLQVFIQARPPAEMKGRMIATQNLLNWIGIVLAAVIYGFVKSALSARDYEPNNMFAVAAVFVVIILLFYRPQTVDLGTQEDKT